MTTLPTIMMTLLTVIMTPLLVQHLLVKTENGKNAKNSMVLLVVKSDVLLILAFSNVTMVPILKVPQRQNVSRMLIRLSLGTRILVHALLVMTTLPTIMMTLLTVIMTPLLVQ